MAVIILLLTIFLTNTPDEPEHGQETRSGETDFPSDLDTNGASTESIAVEPDQPPAAETGVFSDGPIFSCPEPKGTEELDIAAMAAALKNSDDPEHLLMASLYDGERRRAEPSPFPAQRNLDSLFRGLEIEPRNELLLWNAMTLCAESGEEERCDGYNVPELATAALGNNANFWFRLAAIRANADDMEGAFSALERSLAAPEYKEYFIEHVELFARGISAFNNAPYNERVVAAIGMTAALQAPELGLHQECNQQAPNSTDWLYVCIDIGRQMEVRGRTLLTEFLGLRLQQAMYEIAGDDRRARVAEARLKARRKLQTQTTAQNNEIAVLTYDERVLEAYFDAWQADGERQALLFLQNETARLMRVPGYNPCK